MSEHVKSLMAARSHLIDVKMSGYPESSYHPDSDIGKALEAAELSIELAWSLIEVKLGERGVKVTNGGET